jgi:two-component system, OmpR family, sensor histidine kinase BaeS
MPPDPARIAQILGNLLTNAVAHTPAQGTITLRLAVGVEALPLSVSDTGEGISAEHLSHIFDRFYHTDRSCDRGNGGAGLVDCARADGTAWWHGQRC